jgi:hypothetical protein
LFYEKRERGNRGCDWGYGKLEKTGDEDRKEAVPYEKQRNVWLITH